MTSSSFSLLALCSVFLGCVPGFPHKWSYFPESVSLSTDSVRANTPGLQFGMQMEKGIFYNDLFKVELIGHSSGYVVEMENLTEFMLILNWKKCSLVDCDNWTHGILHPDLMGDNGPDILIAPYAKRRVFMVPSMMRRHQLNRPNPRGTFHPTLREIQNGKNEERLILNIGYREDELIYDLGITWNYGSNSEEGRN